MSEENNNEFTAEDLQREMQQEVEENSREEFDLPGESEDFSIPEVEEEEKQEEPSEDVLSIGSTNKVDETFVTISNLSSEEIAEEISEMNKKYSPQDLERKFKQGDTDLSSIINLSVAQNLTNFTDRIAKEIGRLHDVLKEVPKHLDIKSNHGSNISGTLNEEKAKMLFSATLQGLKKVYLLNSGFYVVLKPLDLNDIDDLVGLLDQKRGEFGFMLGGHDHIIDDFRIKEEVMKVVHSCIISSNFKDWKNQTRFLSATSFLDYWTLLWALTTMLYPKGYEMKRVCGMHHTVKSEDGEVKKQCFQEDKFNVDLRKLRLYNTGAIPEEAMTILLSKDQLKLSDLKEYQKLVAKHDKFRYDIRIEDGVDGSRSFDIYFQIPSMLEYFEHANNIFKSIAKSIVDVDNSNNDRELQKAIILFYQTLTPYVSRIDVLTKDGVIHATADKPETVNPFFAELTKLIDKKDLTLVEKIREFKFDKQVCYIGYELPPCSKCGQVKEDKIQSFDLQSAFFTMARHKLQ